MSRARAGCDRRAPGRCLDVLSCPPHRADVPALLSGAPAWPEESAFRAFHDALCEHLVAPKNGPEPRAA